MTTPVLLCIIAIAVPALAQPPQFDAASVKIGEPTLVPMVSGRMTGGPGTRDPRRITYRQVRLKEILMKAWGVQRDQIAGPPWLTDGGPSDSYTITATMPPDTTQEKFRMMLQHLLIERFRIRFHHETRNVASFELVVAPGGSKLKESDPNIPPPDTGPPTGADKDGFPLLPPGHGAGIVSVNGEHAKFQDYTLADLCTPYLRLFVTESFGADQGPIVDKTGLTGRYDFTLKFDARNSGDVVVSPAIRASIAPATSGADHALYPGSGLPGLFIALKKQLGLRLVRVKELPLDVLVIDHIEKVPLEN